MIYRCRRRGCQKEVRGREAKLCGRCLLSTYCSKECQVADWTSHRDGCIEPAERHLYDDGSARAKREALFSRWMFAWQDVFIEYAVLALDLANYPDRHQTHGVVIYVQPNPVRTRDKLRKLIITRTTLAPLAELALLPGWASRPAQPRKCFLALIFETPLDGRRTRLTSRAVSCELHCLDVLRRQDSAWSAAAAAAWGAALQAAVETCTPAQAHLALRRMEGWPAEFGEQVVSGEGA